MDVADVASLVSEEMLLWKPEVHDYASGVFDLHQEILDFYAFMKPRKAEENMRKDVVSRVEEVVLKSWPTAEVVVFGSFKTNFYLPTSDIDLIVYCKWDQLPLRTLGKALQTSNIAETSSIKVDDKSRVPGIKLTDKTTGVNIDLRFNVYAGVKAADFVLKNIEIYPCLRPLVVVLQYFLLQRDLYRELTGGVCSYCLILMVVSLMQNRVQSESLEENLGVLLIEFFNLYGNEFDYVTTGIRVKDGGSYFSKQEVLNDNNGELNASLLCIEDPFIPDNYVGQSSYNYVQVKQAFQYAYNALSKAESNVNPITEGITTQSLLSGIVRVPKDVVKYRESVEVSSGVSASVAVPSSSTTQTHPENDF